MTRPAFPVSVTVTENGSLEQLLMTNTRQVVDGVELRLMKLSGWWDTPDVRSNPIDVTGGDGTDDDAPLFGARTIIVQGAAYATDPDALLAMSRKFQGMLAGVNRLGTVAVSELGQPGRYCDVRLGGASNFDITLPTRADFSMSLYAARPRRLSVDHHVVTTSPYVASGGVTFPWTFPLDFGDLGSVGQIQLVNNGDIPTGLKVTINGDFVNPQIDLLDTNQRIAIVGDLIGTLVIDTEGRSALLNGSPISWAMTADSAFFLVPPGTSTLLCRVSSGTCTFTADWADATP